MFSMTRRAIEEERAETKQMTGIFKQQFYLNCSAVSPKTLKITTITIIITVLLTNTVQAKVSTAFIANQ